MNALLPYLAPRSALTGTTLVREGEAQTTLFALISGTVSVRLSGEEIASVTGPAWLGEIGFIDGLEATASLVTSEPCEIGELDSDGLEALVAGNPTAASHLLTEVAHTLSSRLKEASGGIVEAVGDERFRLRPAASRSRLRRAWSRLAGA